MATYTVEPLTHELLSQLRTSRRKWAYPEIYRPLLAGDPIAVRFTPEDLGPDEETRRAKFDRIRSSVNRWLRSKGIVCEHRYDRSQWLAAWSPQGDGSEVLSPDYPATIQERPPTAKERRRAAKAPKSTFEKKMRPPDPPDLMEALHLS